MWSISRGKKLVTIAISPMFTRISILRLLFAMLQNTWIWWFFRYIKYILHYILSWNESCFTSYIVFLSLVLLVHKSIYQNIFPLVSLSILIWIWQLPNPTFRELVSTGVLITTGKCPLGPLGYQWDGPFRSSMNFKEVLKTKNKNIVLGPLQNPYQTLIQTWSLIGQKGVEKAFYRLKHTF